MSTTHSKIRLTAGFATLSLILWTPGLLQSRDSVISELSNPAICRMMVISDIIMRANGRKDAKSAPTAVRQRRCIGQKTDFKLKKLLRSVIQEFLSLQTKLSAPQVMLTLQIGVSKTRIFVLFSNVENLTFNILRRYAALIGDGKLALFLSSFNAKKATNKTKVVKC